MQVLSLSQDQINALAESERNAIMQLVSRFPTSYASALSSIPAHAIHGGATHSNLMLKKKFLHAIPHIHQVLAVPTVQILPSVLGIHSLVLFFNHEFLCSHSVAVMHQSGVPI